MDVSRRYLLESRNAEAKGRETKKEAFEILSKGSVGLDRNPSKGVRANQTSDQEKLDTARETASTTSEREQSNFHERKV